MHPHPHPHPVETDLNKWTEYFYRIRIKTERWRDGWVSENRETKQRERERGLLLARDYWGRGHNTHTHTQSSRQQRPKQSPKGEEEEGWRLYFSPFILLLLLLLSTIQFTRLLSSPFAVILSKFHRVPPLRFYVPTLSSLLFSHFQ